MSDEHPLVDAEQSELLLGSADVTRSPTVENSPTRYKAYATRWSDRLRTETQKVRDAGSWKELIKRAAPSPHKRRRTGKARSRRKIEK
jgi:hypothetical protein